MKTKLSFREYVSVASMLFGMFFGAGNLIFPIALGQHAGSNVWLAFRGSVHHRRRYAPAGCGRSGHQPFHRPVRPVQQGGTPLWDVLYLPVVPDHRPLLRHPPLCHHLLHRRSGTDPAPERLDLALSAPVLCPVLCRRPVLLPPSGENFDLDRQSPQPRLPALPGHPGHRGPAPSRRSHRSGGTVGRLCLSALLHRFSGGLQHHGRPGQPGLWHRGRPGHQGLGRGRPWRGGQQHRPFRYLQLPVHGRHLPGCHHRRRPEPRPI